MITFDEHGGTYDHVAPPAAPPHPSMAPGQMNFSFDRSGVRVPTIAVSAWIPRQTVVTDQYRATSVIATLRNRWQLGEPLTARDAVAPDLGPVMSLETPRDPADWPEVKPRPVPPFTAQVPAPEAALVGLAEGIELILDLTGDAFTHLHG